MQIYSDHFGRVIWLTISPAEVRMDLQDLGSDFEYERCATVSEVGKLCESLNVTYEELQAALLLRLENQMTAFDLFTELLDDHHIQFEYFSG